MLYSHGRLYKLPNYVQKFNNGYVHTIMNASDELQGGNVVEVPDYNEWYARAYYDGTNFMGLELTTDNNGQVALNTPLNVTVQWADISGQTAARDCTVTIKCGELTEQIAVVGGVGSTSFQSAEPGEFSLETISLEGCRAVGKVIVG